MSELYDSLLSDLAPGEKTISFEEDAAERAAAVQHLAAYRNEVLDEVLNIIATRRRRIGQHGLVVLSLTDLTLVVERMKAEMS